MKEGEKMRKKDRKKSCRGQTVQASVNLQKEVKQMLERQKAMTIALQSISQRLMLIEKELFVQDKL